MFDPSKLPEQTFFVIAGPCVIESRELCLRVADHLLKVCGRLDLRLIFKGSFDKANRSSGSSYRGPGIEQGLRILEEVRATTGLPVLSDVHETEQARVAGEVLDVLQVPAFLARQTDLLQACGRTGKWVNIKKGQFMSPHEMSTARRKVLDASNDRVMLTERGTFFGYGKLVNDFTSLAVMRATGSPVVFDVTHSTQQPAALGASSGGDPTMAPLLARAAIASGVSGLFIECHPDPQRALSDATSMLPLDAMEPLLETCLAIARLRKGW